MTFDTFRVVLDLFVNLSGNKISFLAQFKANLLPLLLLLQVRGNGATIIHPP
jgi:hypothetical protein